MKKLLIAVLFIACGGEDENYDCNKEDRHGTYRVTATYISGSCGAFGTFYVQLDHGREINDCIITHNEWSEDECTLNRSMTCTIFVSGGPSGSTTYTMNWTQTSTQQDKDGEVFSGNVSLRSEGSDGTACSGSYQFTYHKVSD